MSNKKTLDDIFSEIKNIKKLIQELDVRSATIEETNNLQMHIINDISAKLDIEFCAINLKTNNMANGGSSKIADKSVSAISDSKNTTTNEKNTKKKSVKEEVDKKKMNIMAYFKHKWKEGPETLYDVLDKKEIEKILKSHENELKNKKGDIEAAKASIIYKELISGNKTNQNRLRTKKEKEEEVEHQAEIIECNVQDYEEKDYEAPNHGELIEEETVEEEHFVESDIDEDDADISDQD